MHQFYKVSADSFHVEGTLPPAQSVVLVVVALFALDVESRRYRIGGAKRDRTADPLRARQVLSQLSYSPIFTGLFPVMLRCARHSISHLLM